MVEVMVSVPAASLTVSVPSARHRCRCRPPPIERVGAPAPPSRMLAAALPVMRVGEPIAGAVDGGGAQQGQVLDRRKRGQRAGDGRGDGVDAAGVGDGVGAVGEHIGVVAGATDQVRRSPSPPSRMLAAALPVMRVREPIAGAVDRGGPQQGQVLDRRKRGKRAGDGRGDGVDAAGIGDGVGAVGRAHRCRCRLHRSMRRCRARHPVYRSRARQ